MPRQTKTKPKQSMKRPPAKTPEAQEKRMIALANDLAEQQLLDGTASSQIITHFLKVGSTKEAIEKEILEKQKDLITAKTEQLKSHKKLEALFTDALEAMREYSGAGHNDKEKYNDDED